MSSETVGPMPEAFGGYIHYLRVRVRHLSQREFCASAGVDPHTLSQVEAGYQAPWDEATIGRVAAVLDVDAGDLLDMKNGWSPAAPPHFNVRTYLCFVCGADITSHPVYHETESGRRICVEHLSDPAHYWTEPAPAPEVQP